MKRRGWITLGTAVVLLLVMLLGQTAMAADTKGTLTVKIGEGDYRFDKSEVGISLYRIGIEDPNKAANWIFDKAFAGIDFVNDKNSSYKVRDLIRQNGATITVYSKVSGAGSYTFKNLDKGVYYGEVSTAPEGLTAVPFIVTIPGKKDVNWTNDMTVVVKYEYIDIPPETTPPETTPPATTPPATTPPATTPPATTPPATTPPATTPPATTPPATTPPVSETTPPDEPVTTPSPTPTPTPSPTPRLTPQVTPKPTPTPTPEPPKEPYKLTIHYIFEDGTPALPTLTETHWPGEPYDHTSPEIPGYVVTIIRIEGIQPHRDVEYTVVYIPKRLAERMITLEDYETALGLGDIQMHVGVCYD